MGKKSSAYNMYEAKTRLSEIVEKVRTGEEVVLMNRGEPVAKVIPFQLEAKKRRFGGFRNKIELRDGWDAPLEDFEDYSK